MITFRPNCTLPDGSTSGFVNASNVRSTMDIVWSCLGIIILSTWSILHPNIPPDFRKQTKWQFYLQKLYSIARKALWMIVMFVAPEVLTSLYAHKMFSARHNDTILQRLAAKQQVPWSRTHTVFADMGGFAVYFSDKELYPSLQGGQSQDNKLACLLKYFKGFVCQKKKEFGKIIQRPKKENSHFIDRFEAKQSFFFGWFGELLWERREEHENLATSIKDGLVVQKEDAHWKLQNLAALSGDIWVLDSAQLIAAVEGEIIELPKITKKELQDKSKSDALVKFLAIMQVLWLIIQLAARKYYGLASTPLEISTVALSASTIILYILEWNKPKDVNIPIYIRAKEVGDSQETDASQATNTSPGTTNTSLGTTRTTGTNTSSTISRLAFEKAFNEVFRAAPYPYLRFPIIPTKLYQIPSCAFHVAQNNTEKKNNTEKNNNTEKQKNVGNDRVWVQTAFVAVAPIISFGGIHLFAWNFHFPTDVERLLWRVCAVAATFLPLPYLATHYPFMKHGTEVKKRRIRQTRAIQAIFAFFYVLARLFLITESVRSLYYLPPRAFISTWSVNFPHWG